MKKRIMKPKVNKYRVWVKCVMWYSATIEAVNQMDAISKAEQLDGGYYEENSSQTSWDIERVEQITK